MATENNTATIAGSAIPSQDGHSEEGLSWRLFSRLMPAVADAASSHWRLLLEWQRRDEERRRLHELDDRMLKDIGLTRDQVDETTKKPFWLP